MTNTNTNTSAPAPLRHKFAALRDDIAGSFAERDEHATGLVTAALAGEHVLLLGPAGTGKSALANSFFGALGGSAFSWLMTRFTVPEEIFGSVSVKGLQDDKFERVTTGKLPTADFAFLDEIFKANSAILNALLTAINERRFDNGARRESIPLSMVVGASNELPESDELAALYDRFLVRYWIDYVTRPESFEAILLGSEPEITTTVTAEELAAARAEVAAIPVRIDTVGEMFKLRHELAQEGITASDRRWKKALKLMRASAWLVGDSAVTPNQIGLLADVLWNTPEQEITIRKAVSKYGDAELVEATTIYDSIVDLFDKVPTDVRAPDFMQRVSVASRESMRAIERLRELSEKADTTSARIAELAATVERKREEVRAASERAIGF